MSESINIQEAKTHLSRLVDMAAKGQPFVIAKAGRPLDKVVPLIAPGQHRELGFMAAHGTAAVDVKSAFVSDIDAMFNAAPLSPALTAPSA